MAPTRRPSSSTRVHARSGGRRPAARPRGRRASTQRPGVEPVGDLQRAVAERVGQQLAQPAGAGRRADPREQVRHGAGAREARAQQAEQERPAARAAKAISASDAERVDRRRSADRRSRERAGEQREQREARPQHGRHRAPLRRRGRPPALRRRITSDERERDRREDGLIASRCPARSASSDDGRSGAGQPSQPSQSASRRTAAPDRADDRPAGSRRRRARRWRRLQPPARDRPAACGRARRGRARRQQHADREDDAAVRRRQHAEEPGEADRGHQRAEAVVRPPPPGEQAGRR